MYKDVFVSEVCLEAIVTCRNCKEILKFKFRDGGEQKDDFECKCGKCTLRVFPRKRSYVVQGDYVDNSVSVVTRIIEGYKGERKW